MKIAVSGKGGVGKTTIAGSLARDFAFEGFKVLAIDADPNPNLALTLGLSSKEAAEIVPVSEDTDLIEEKTGVKPGSSGGVFRISFSVDDIIDKYSIKTPEGIYLLVMGTVKSAGGGCMCPANTLVRNLLRHLLTKRNEIIVVDLEAGTEHLGRGTAESVDIMLIVAEANLKVLETTKKVANLSKQLGIKKVFVVGNRVTSTSEEKMIMQFCYENGLPLLGLIPYDEEMKQADAKGKILDVLSPESIGLTAIRKMKENLTKIMNKAEK